MVCRHVDGGLVADGVLGFPEGCGGLERNVELGTKKHHE